MGHGKSTLIGLRKALELEADIIISLDGDAQFKPSDLKCLFEEFTANPEWEVMEGVRQNRNESWFRVVISFLIKILILAKSKKYPKDANTPLKLYRRIPLGKIINLIPPGSIIPNMDISKVIRKNDFNFTEIKIDCFPRGLGVGIDNSSDGVTWNQKHKFLPSRRLVQFCITAIKEWIKH